MGASKADSTWQMAKSIPDLPDRSLTMTTIRLVTPFTAESTAAEVVAGIDLSGRRAIVTGVASGMALRW
jgi:hypothetical protein